MNAKRCKRSPKRGFQKEEKTRQSVTLGIRHHRQDVEPSNHVFRIRIPPLHKQRKGVVKG